MYKFAGVTLDYYDDRGETLKAIFPIARQLPDFIKNASVAPAEKLPDEAFALVMVDSGHVFRKFACVDEGTTAMSTIYFMEHGDKLPETAQKTAAANITKCCLAYGLVPPPLMVKKAGNLFTKSALDILSGGEADGQPDSKYSPSQLEMGQGIEKEHTDSSALAREIARDHLEEIPDYYTRLKKMESDALQAKEANVVDVTGRGVKPLVKKASPTSNEDYAVILSDGSRKYPIHTWEMVKTAEAYYADESIRMRPPIRRQFAVKLASKAASLGYPLNGEILQAGATSYHADGFMKQAVEIRKIACVSRHGREFLDELFEKRSSVHPEVYAECLRQFDMDQGLDSGWDHIIPDPWSSTFGFDKRAEVIWKDGTDRVTSEELENLAVNHIKCVKEEFTDDVASAFQKDPIEIFNSMPTPQKKILVRMANDSSAQGGSESSMVE